MALRHLRYLMGIAEEGNLTDTQDKGDAPSFKEYSEHFSFSWPGWRRQSM
ncbi:hypothetical protein [Paraburkholderia bannensis]|nr:hypothetical protein [Paraburkholderia bannensis]